MINSILDDGICIPQSYTSYIGPVQSSKLYNEIRLCFEKDKHPLTHFETPYVVYLHNKYNIAKEQSLFTFTHPNRGNEFFFYCLLYIISIFFFFNFRLLYRIINLY